MKLEILKERYRSIEAERQDYLQKSFIALGRLQEIESQIRELLEDPNDNCEENCVKNT
jgi:hypothetical protein